MPATEQKEVRKRAGPPAPRACVRACACPTWPLPSHPTRVCRAAPSPAHLVAIAHTCTCSLCRLPHTHAFFSARGARCSAAALVAALRARRRRAQPLETAPGRALRLPCAAAATATALAIGICAHCGLPTLLHAAGRAPRTRINKAKKHPIEALARITCRAHHMPRASHAARVTCHARQPARAPPPWPPPLGGWRWRRSAGARWARRAPRGCATRPWR
jgi:hypothetical protein